jgi:cytochrome c6
MGGGNVVNAERTLKKDALEAYLANYADGHEAAIVMQVTNGKNAMPAFGGKLSESDIADVAAYVEDMSSKGWA